MSKCYTITSTYSQGSQVQIQGIHASDELFARYLKEYKDNELGALFYDWMTVHKTRVDLKINDPEDIENIAAMFERHVEQLKVPFATFQEPRMKFTTTAICFVAPDALCHPIQYAVYDFFEDLRLDKDAVSFFDIVDFNGLFNESGDKKSRNYKGCVFSYKDESTVGVSYLDRKGSRVFLDLNLAQLEFYRVIRRLPTS